MTKTSCFPFILIIIFLLLLPLCHSALPIPVHLQPHRIHFIRTICKLYENLNAIHSTITEHSRIFFLSVHVLQLKSQAIVSGRPESMDGIWDPPDSLANEDIVSFCHPYDVIEETDINVKCCIHVLEVLITKADADIVEHEEVLVDLLSQLACTDEVFSDMFAMSLRAKIDFLDSSIRKLKDDAEDFLSTSREPAESINDILKSLFCCYLQKKDLQFADNTGTTSSCNCQVPTDNQKKQIGSSSNANQMEKKQRVNMTPVAKQIISPTLVKVKEENTYYPHTSPVPKYAPRSLCWGSTKKTDREVSKFQIKSPIIMKKEILQNRTPGFNSICSKSSLETQGKFKHQLNVIKSQTYDESMSLATVPYVESSEEANAMSLATVPYVESSEEANAMRLATVPYVESSEEANAMCLATVPYVESSEEANAMCLATIPYVESHEEANAKQIIIKELEFPPGYTPQHHQKQGPSRPRRPYSARTYTRRKKANAPLQSSSNPPCLALVVANPLDKHQTYSNVYMEDYYTVSDLRAIAKQLKIKGYCKFRKAELAQVLGIKFIEGRKQLKKQETQLVPMIKYEP